MRDPQDEPSDLIRSVSRALHVLEAVGSSPRGLSVKQIARRCDLTTATTYHLVRTLAYEGYLIRREDGTYLGGPAVAQRFTEMAAALRGPASVGEALRRAAHESGYSHFLGTFVNGRVVLAAVAEGPRSPYLEELIPGFDDGAHATALGKALLATLTPEQRAHYLREFGMRPYTPHTLVTAESLEADLAAGERRGMQIEINQYRQNLACAALGVLPSKDAERRVVVACAMPPADLVGAGTKVRARLAAAARTIAASYGAKPAA